MNILVAVKICFHPVRACQATVRWSYNRKDRKAENLALGVCFLVGGPCLDGVHFCIMNDVIETDLRKIGRTCCKVANSLH